MYIAYIAVGAIGHVMPTLPFISELVRRKVRVSYFAPEYLRKTVEPTGADFFAVESVLTNDGAADNDINVDFIAGLPKTFLTEAKTIIGSILRVLEKDVPDLIMHDQIAIAGRLAAARLGLPRIQVYTSYAANEHFSISRFWPAYPDTHPVRAEAKKIAEELSSEFGVPPIDVYDIFERPGDLNISVLSREFQPAGDTFDESFCFAGAQIGERSGSGSWEIPSNGKPLVFTSLGTLFNDWPEFYKMLFEAVRDLDINVVSSIGTIIDPGKLGDIPENVKLYSFLPQLEVLKHASLFVSHCGTGSVMEAAYFGVPIIGVPQMDEQMMTAKRVEELGMGIFFPDKNAVSSESLKKAICDMLQSAQHKQRAAELSEKMREAGGFGRIADETVRFISERLAENAEKEKVFGSYKAWKAEGDVWFIQFMEGSQLMYLVEGDESALLIDTGWGAGNIREFAEKLTDKPVFAANTHGHLDHAGGNGLWERVYVPERAEIDLLSLNASPVNIKRLPHPDYERVYMHDGGLIRLGNRDIVVWSTNAHCEGHVYFFDRKAGYLFCGDELESAQVILIKNEELETAGLNVRCRRHLAAMERIAEHMSEIAHICPAHNGSPISKDYVYDFIELDKRMLSGTQELYPIDHRFVEQRPDAQFIRRARCRKASFLYSIKQ